jgi:hypothetical protein
MTFSSEFNSNKKYSSDRISSRVHLRKLNFSYVSAMIRCLDDILSKDFTKEELITILKSQKHEEDKFKVAVQ